MHLSFLSIFLRMIFKSRPHRQRWWLQLHFLKLKRCCWCFHRHQSRSHYSFLPAEHMSSLYLWWCKASRLWEVLHEWWRLAFLAADFRMLWIWKTTNIKQKIISLSKPFLLLFQLSKWGWNLFSNLWRLPANKYQTNIPTEIKRLKIFATSKNIFSRLRCLMMSSFSVLIRLSSKYMTSIYNCKYM